MSERMQVRVQVPANGMRRWQLQVLDALAADAAIALAVETIGGPSPLPPGVDLLFAFERSIGRAAGAMAVDRVPLPQALAPTAAAGDRADLVVDLTGLSALEAVDVARRSAPVLRFGCLGLEPMVGALAAILDDLVPVLTADLVDGPGGRRLAAWAVAIEDRNNGLRAASMVFGRLAHLVLCSVEAVRRAGPGGDAGLYCADPTAVPATIVSPGPFAAAALLALTLQRRIANRLDRMARGRVDWRVIYRMRSPDTFAEAPLSDAAPFHLLPDDGQRFYADPFPITVDGRSWLFVEEFPYATGRGLISVGEIDVAGRVGPLRPVLEAACHLSYPNVFIHRDRVWMVPETASRGTVELWVAEAFPDRWTQHSILLEGVEAADATFAVVDGVWWMFAATRAPWASSWDSLQIWRADDLFGPWTPVGTAPVVVDVGSARPAGRILQTGGDLLRPVQDSRLRYGGGMALTRIEALTPDRFAERIDMRFPVSAPLLGLHTWNQSAMPSGLFEAMDIYADPARTGAAIRLG